MEGYSGQISRHEKHQQGDESTGSSVWHSSQKPSQDHIRSGSANMYRRTRKPNYSHEETIVLLEQIEIHRHILFGKATNHQRTELWNFIADAVNALPHSAGRTIEELKHRWKDISHRARLSARNIAQAKANNEQIAITPSMYFDIIMRILGEDVSEGSDFGMLSFNDSQNSSSRFIEDGHMSPGKFEVDIKPDINVINRYLGGE
uniref:Myb-like domain-containing protein n=1 Tax=Arion vulgaris TaxID=1028688 RepID=A0A0B7A788_9EUPU